VDGAEGDDARRTRFEALVGDVAEPVRRFLARRADPDTADDVLADTLLVLWRRLDDVPEGDEALPWTYAVARNALANAERGRRRQRRLAHRITVTDPPREAAPPEPEADDRVTAALARMRPDEAELLRLWAWEQLGPTEIAAVLDLTPNAVSIRLHRARGRFKEIFEGRDEGDDGGD
jgi:RNA polymerase sigma-70 factor (ECF subfamily)